MELNSIKVNNMKYIGTLFGRALYIEDDFKRNDVYNEQMAKIAEKFLTDAIEKAQAKSE